VNHVLRRCPLPVLALAAAVLALAGGFAYGAIPDAGGVYTACVHSTTGALRLIDPSTGAACHSTERQVTWGKQGPQGVQGPQGIQGAPGVFNGSFSSPNGKFTLSVTDAGIELTGPVSKVSISDQGTTVDGFAIFPIGSRQFFRGTEQHFDSEQHFGFEQHEGSEQHRGFEQHFGSEFHDGSSIVFAGGTVRFFTFVDLMGNCLAADPIPLSGVLLANGKSSAGARSCFN
jgi:hypothetical protein